MSTVIGVFKKLCGTPVYNCPMYWVIHHPKTREESVSAGII
jgi:hypothetical protein